MIVFTLTDVTTFFSPLCMSHWQTAVGWFDITATLHTSRRWEKKKKRSFLPQRLHFLATAAAFTVKWEVIPSWWIFAETSLNRGSAAQKITTCSILRIKSLIPPGSPLPLLASSWGKGRDREKMKTMTKLRVSPTHFGFAFHCLCLSCVQHRSGSECVIRQNDENNRRAIHWWEFQGVSAHSPNFFWLTSIKKREAVDGFHQTKITTFILQV